VKARQPWLQPTLDQIEERRLLREVVSEENQFARSIRATFGLCDCGAPRPFGYCPTCTKEK
jgi:hypothetical protein